MPFSAGLAFEKAFPISKSVGILKLPVVAGRLSKCEERKQFDFSHKRAQSKNQQRIFGKIEKSKH